MKDETCNGLVWLVIVVFFIIISSSMVVTSCTESKFESSGILTEPAIVADLVYTPSRHGSDVAPTIGFTGGGNVSVGITPISVDIPEAYAIVFKCQHGKFVIDCNNPERMELWKKLEEKQKVIVSYKEKYEVPYKGNKKLVKYEFIDAK